MLKNSRYRYYLSRFQYYLKHYGIKEALRRSFLKFTKWLHINKFFKNVLFNINADVFSQLIYILSNTSDRKGIIIYPSIIDWNFPLFQRPQQLSVAFAKRGFLVFYYTPNYRYDNYFGFHEISKYLYVCNVNPEVFVKANVQPVIIINWPTEKPFLNSLDKLNTKVIYDHLDHIKLLSNYNESILKDHIQLIKESSIVTVTATDLYNEAKKYRDDIILCPNGVDIEHFTSTVRRYPEEIREILKQGKPMIGYSGALAKWFDYDLIAYCASLRPDYNFILIGYEHDPSFKESGLEKFKNVFKVGPVNYKVLPKYLKAIDIAMIPFKVNSITIATSPVKLFEYAACKKPIVTTELNECKKYEVVLISKSKEEFLMNIDKALELKNDEAYLNRLETLARENSWDKRVEIMSGALNRIVFQPKVMHFSYDIISFPIMPWFSRFQRSQQLLTKLSANGSRVFRVDTTFLHDNKNYILEKIQENIFNVKLQSSKELSIYKDSIEKNSLNKMLISLDNLRIDQLISNAICIVELPFWYPVVEKLNEKYGWKIIYDCMDEHGGFSTNETDMLSKEVELAKESDLVVVTSKNLYDKMTKLNNNCILLPNATDFEYFNNLPENEILKDISKPIIGYYGAISDWFDNTIIEYAAETRKDWNFILIGNTFGADISRLSKLPNVRLLGEKPYSELSKYLYWFDICIIPFKLNKLTEATNPVKFYEYISSGKPVVSTKIPELVSFEDYLYLADGKEDFVKKIATALAENSKEIRDKRIKLAKENTWDKRHAVLNVALGNLYPMGSIIVVSFNNLELTKLCLSSIYFRSQYPNFEIIIVDNNSSDGTREYLTEISSKHKNIKLILNDDNRGFAAANNQAIKMAEGDYIILLNNDTVVTSGWITRLLRYLDDKSIGMVGPVTNMCGNEAKISVSYDTRTLEGFEEFISEYFRRHPDQEYFEIDMLGMFCVAMRRETIDEIGLLDERFGIGTFEDTDYSHRVKLEGYKIICAKNIFIHHFCNASFGKLPPDEYLRIYEENKRKFEEKWGFSLQEKFKL
jgi:GT2 family glycosyltransferase